jgi:uncharacterized Zn ribbon protein
MSFKDFMLFSMMIFILLTSSAYSLEIVNFQDVNGETFYSGDSVDLGTVLVNNESTQVNITVEQYLIYPGIEPMPLYETFVIEPNNNTMISDLSFDVSEYSKSGTYVHSVRIYESDNVIGEKTTTFYVAGALDSFSDCEAVICYDTACDDVGLVFDAGETVYVKVECPQNSEIKGYLVYDDTFKDLYFTTGLASFKADPDIMNIRVVLSKEGFAEKTIQKEITVTGEMAGGSPTSILDNNLLIIVFLAAVIVIAGLLAFWKMKGSKSKK